MRLNGSAALLALVALFGLPAGMAEAAKEPIYTQRFSALAASGYDPVAYFSEGRPVKGDPAFAYEWNGATWRFASAANLETFTKNPDAFAPRYGGYCAWAVSQGYTASSDPTAWSIVEGRLYLNYSASVKAQWEVDIPGNIKKADGNWPAVLSK